MAPEKCPICHEEIVQDAHAKEHCELCGMAISKPEDAPHFLTNKGETLHFCCDRCLSIYLEEIIDNEEVIETLKEQRDFSVLGADDEVVRDIIIKYINKKYPLKEE
jgi:endogenous inhibitor of DNA gyrase (YacG/DUF329 family)